MGTLEKIIIDLLLNFVSVNDLNEFIRDPRTVAIIIGSLVSISGALLGVFLLLRGMSMVTDAISHTVLLGIVLAFIFVTADLNSPWLIIGAAAAGVVTVTMTELIQRSGLVKADAALGLAFPFLFALAIILISRAVDDVHLDEDSVMVGEIGAAWANTNSYCFEGCAEVVITEDDPRARFGRECTNCTAGGISPLDDEAEFEQICVNCGSYSAAEAWRDRLVSTQPQMIFWPKAISIMTLITLVNLLFVTLFYKELKIATFDSALAATLGLRPGVIHYTLMILVSVTAVGAFDAVGSVLVVAFFIIPAATLYLLTDRLSLMLLGSPMIGALSAISGYEFSRGNFLGILDLDRVLEGLDRTIGLDGFTRWDTSISASMVIMMFLFFLLAWIFSPRYGVISTMIRRTVQRRVFADQVVMGHIYNHQHNAEELGELAADSLHKHFEWSKGRMQWVLARLRAVNLVQIDSGLVHLTERGIKQVDDFREAMLK